MDRPVRGHRYTLALALASALILAGGVYLKPEKTPAPVPSEAAVQRIRPTDSLRRIGVDLAEIVAAAAPPLVWVPAARASGVVWGPSGSVITAGRDGPVSLPLSTPDAQLARLREDRLGQGEWLAVAARTASGGLVWSAGIYGGERTVRCGDSSLQEIVTGVPLTEAFAGAAVVDLDSRVAGLVVRCGERLAAIGVSAFSAALAAARPVREWERLHGVETNPLDQALRTALGAPQGEIVVAVPVGGATGLRPGDVLLDTEPGEDGAVSVLRSGRRIRVRIPAPVRTRGLVVSGSRVTVVEPESAAARAGVQPGDTLPRESLRALAAEGPVFVEWEREGMRRGALLP